MKLLSIELRNFRVFYGKQLMSFASSSSRNTTLVYGANGSGKSTLLNAFTWALYNRFTPAFENPDKLISDRALAEAVDGVDVESSVEVKFEHNGDEYTAKRRQVERRNGSIWSVTVKAALEVSILEASGKTIVRGNGEETIEQILPKDLYNFFFFDGERIEKLVNAQGKGEISKAIKSLLDLEILERSIRHLAEAQRSLEVDLADGPSSETSVAKEALEKMRYEQELVQADLRVESDNVAAYRMELDAVANKLRTLENVKGFQIQRDQLVQQRAQLDSAQVAASSLIEQRISKDGFTLFLGEAIEITSSVIEDKRLKGQLPSSISGQFITDLLTQGRCICGTKLASGDEHYLRLEALQKTAGHPAMEEALITLGNVCTYYRQQGMPVMAAIQAEYRRIDQIKADVLRVDEQLSQISQMLTENESEDVVSLEDNRSSLLVRDRKSTEKIGELKSRLRNIEDQLKVLQKKLLEAAANTEKSALAQRRVRAAIAVRECLEQVLAVQTSSVRLRLNDDVSRVFRSISFKDYTPRIDDDFSLSLVRENGEQEDPVAKSTGEAQLLSLSFVGAIAQQAYKDQAMARTRAKAAESVVGAREGGFYPVVMDSPFGNLDVDYQGPIARALPELAPQVVILVSRSQAGNVEQKLAPRVGRSYVINFHTSKADAESAMLEAFGRKVPIITPSPMESDWAEIRLIADLEN